MFADFMNFDNLRRNIREFEDIIEINSATDGKEFSSYIIIARAYQQIMKFRLHH